MRSATPGGGKFNRFSLNVVTSPAPSPPTPVLLGSWHCFVGRNLSCFVTHEAGKFVYFYVGQMGIIIFATA